MEFLFTHWHCVLPAAAILGAMIFMRGRQKGEDEEADARQERIPGAPGED
jgi:hypothetical protein